ncbi:MAG TPA: THUMP domain-containing protein [Rhabdochlamydiaceae bacterium]|jgi:putative N6-adenine-specific DNA methylase
MDELFITCAEHIEPLLCEELAELRVQGIRPGFRGVYAEKTLDTVYVVNYLSRLATRVLWPLAQFHCEDRDMLYAHAKKIPWLHYLNENKTFAIDANVSHPRLRHSLFAAQVVKDAICDAIRDARGERPSVDVKQPDVQLHLFIHNKQAVISLDTSGAPLYKRGWKIKRGEASLPETLAAALLRRSGYSAEQILCDPFCGTGTLLIEAAYIASRTPPGFLRKNWGFFHMPEHNAQKWENFKNVFDQKRIPLASQSILGADKDLAELSLCKAYVAKLGYDIALTHKEVFSYRPVRQPTCIVTDPPFGKRLQSTKQVYEEFGLFLRAHCTPQSRVFVMAPSEETVQPIGLPIVSQTPLQHGGMQMFLYELSIPS